jgi:spermidine/putrescine transport system permease protein
VRVRTRRRRASYDNRPGAYEAANPHVLLGLPLLAWQCAFFVAPFVFLVLMSFWIVRDYNLVHHFTFDTYSTILTKAYFQDAYVRTLTLSAIAGTLMTALALPFSYALGMRMKPAARQVALLALIAPFFTSYLARTYSWEVLIAERGILNTALGKLGLPPIHILGTASGILIGYFNFAFPLVALVLALTLSNIDRQLIEAANNLGAGRVRSIVTMVLPLAKRGIVFAWSFGFILSFADFMSPTLLGSGNKTTLSILVVSSLQVGSDWATASAIALIMAVTLLIVVFGTFRVVFGSGASARNRGRSR